MKKNTCTSQGDHSPNSYPHHPQLQLLRACYKLPRICWENTWGAGRAQCWKRTDGQGRSSPRHEAQRCLLPLGESGRAGGARCRSEAPASSQPRPLPARPRVRGCCCYQGAAECLEFWGSPQELLCQPPTPSLLAQGDSSLRWSRFSWKL